MYIHCLVQQPEITDPFSPVLGAHLVPVAVIDVDGVQVAIEDDDGEIGLLDHTLTHVSGVRGDERGIAIQRDRPTEGRSLGRV